MPEQEKRIQEQTKDAIEVLGFLKKDFENKAKPRCKFARVRAGLFFAIKALEKQIAKKPKKSGVTDSKGVFHATNGINGVPYDLCPNCEINLCTDGMFGGNKNGMKYCKNCGQKLYW